MLTRTRQHRIIQLTRERRLIERLERKERKRLEEIEWKLPRTNIRTTLLKNFNKSSFGNLHKTNFIATGFSKEEEGKTGLPAPMMKRKRKADPNILALKLMKMLFNMEYEATKELISWFDF